MYYPTLHAENYGNVLPAGGKKSAGKSKKNWVDCLEKDCARANIPYGSLI
jgi:hypothetical protein